MDQSVTLASGISATVRYSDMSFIFMHTASEVYRSKVHLVVVHVAGRGGTGESARLPKVLRLLRRIQSGIVSV